MIDPLPLEQLKTSETFIKAETSEADNCFPRLTFTPPASEEDADQKLRTEEEIDNAIKIACAQAALEASEETRKALLEEHSLRQTNALESIRDHLISNQDVLENWMAEARQTVHEIATYIGKSVGQKALNERPNIDLEECLVSSLKRLIGQPEIQILTNESLTEDLASSIKKIAHDASFRGKIKIESDENLQNGDVRVTWEGGSIERDTKRILLEVDSITAAWIAGQETRPQISETVSKSMEHCDRPQIVESHQNDE